MRVEKRPPNKHVTVIFNVVQGQQTLLVALKKSLGTGGASSGASVEIQGDQSKRVEDFLLANRANVRNLSSKEFPIKVSSETVAEAPPLKQRKKPRWQKARHSGPVVLCSHPLCSWRYCTSSITGECVEQVDRVGIVQDASDWCLIDEDGETAGLDGEARSVGASSPNRGHSGEVWIDYEVLSEYGMVPSVIEKNKSGKQLGAKKAKMMERQSKRTENYAALDRSAGPPPAARNTSRSWSRHRRTRPRRKIGRSSRGYALEDDDYDYEAHLYSHSGESTRDWTESAYGALASHGPGFVNSYAQAPDVRYRGFEDEDDVQRFDFKGGADNTDGNVDGLKDSQVMSFVEDNALDTMYGSILNDVSLTCNLVTFWREVLILVSSDEVAVEDAFLQCLMLFQRTTVTGVSWTCSECTYVNVADATSCSMCETSRQATERDVREETLTTSPATTPVAPSWICKACTYENDAGAIQCMMCRTPKEGNDGAKAEAKTIADPLQQFVDMGFTREAAESCYNRANGDNSATLELLLTGL